MSAINNIYGGNISTGALASLTSVGQANAGMDTDGDNDGSRGVRGAGGGGMFSSAIIQALSQLGVSAVPSVAGTSAGNGASTSTTAADGTASSTQDPKSAMHQFMHDLFAALQAAGSQATTNTPTDSDGDNDGSSASGVSSANSGNRHDAWVSGIENKLHSLIQQLSSTDSSSSTGATGSAVSALQTDFQNLVGTLGTTGGGATLSSFLQAVAQNLQGSNPGLNVSAKV